MSRTLSPTTAFAGAAVTFATFFLAAGAPTPLLTLRQMEWGFSAEALTFAFSVYALALLLALLVGGALSDHVGRRPVLLAALVGELTSMIVFLVAPNITWIVVARILQGLATGLGTTAFSAAIIEHAPVNRKVLAGGLASASVAGGLGIGALVTGAAVEYTSDANTIVFGSLAAIMAAAIVFVAFTSETVTTRPGALRSLIPTMTVPRHARGEFIAGIPVHIAGWMFPTLFLGLSPTLLHVQFGLGSGLVAGVTAFLPPFAAALASFPFGRISPRRSTLTGIWLLLAGMITVAVGVTTAWLPALWIGGILGGVGFGGAFGGQLRLVAADVAHRERAGVFAAVYTVAYTSFAIPVIIAGQLAPRLGLIPTVGAYIGAMAGLAVVALVVQTARARRKHAACSTNIIRPLAGGFRGTVALVLTVLVAVGCFAQVW